MVSVYFNWATVAAYTNIGKYGIWNINMEAVQNKLLNNVRVFYVYIMLDML